MTGRGLAAGKKTLTYFLPRVYSPEPAAEDCQHSHFPSRALSSIDRSLPHQPQVLAVAHRSYLLILTLVSALVILAGWFPGFTLVKIGILGNVGMCSHLTTNWTIILIVRVYSVRFLVY